MTERQQFENVLKWFGIVIEHKYTTELEGGNILIMYGELNECEDRFSSQGYDEFEAGAIYTPDGTIVKSYLDSHVCSSSKNNKLLTSLL
jgi:hypothetical protein